MSTLLGNKVLFLFGHRTGENRQSLRFKYFKDYISYCLSK